MDRRCKILTTSGKREESGEQGTPEHREANLGFRCITAGTPRFLASVSVELEHEGKSTIDEQLYDTAEYLVAQSSLWKQGL